MQRIDYVYYLFPLMTFIISIFEFKNKKLKNYNIFYIAFLFIFLALSKIGADYKNYELIYNMIKDGIPLEYIHSEIGFKKLVQIFIYFNIEYEIFKSVYLGILLIVLGVYLKKISLNLSYSYFLLYSFYIIYLSSAYRQLLVFVITFISFYYYNKNKKNIPIILSGLTMLIHSSSILGLIYFIYLKLQSNRLKLQKNKLITLMVSSFFLRVLFIKNGFLLNKIAIFFGKGGYFTENTTFIGIGLLARMVVCFLMILNIKKIKKNKLILSAFLFYYIGNLLYLSIPFELVIGRLTNNSKLLEVIILPYIIRKQSKKENAIILFLMISLIAFAIFTNQLLNQGGYYPYINIFF